MVENNKLVKKVLLTNDDGIDAPGIAILEKIAKTIAEDVWVVAPITDRSGVSNAISIREPIRTTIRDDRHYAVYGTPADCVNLAINAFMQTSPPDLILSGINRGSNIGFEVLLSGTVGAATMGMLHGIPSIALSQCFNDSEAIYWQTPLYHTPELIQKLLSTGWSKNTCLNINFPHLPPESILGVKVTHQGIGYTAGMNAITVQDPKGDIYHWLRIREEEKTLAADSESKATQDGFITITPISYDRTCTEEQKRLAQILS